MSDDDRDGNGADDLPDDDRDGDGADDLPGGVVDRLAGLPGVRAVALGGSRAQGTHRPDSDWDLAIYYRGSFDPEDLRRIGWRGEVSDVGGWGGGIFNGGAWLDIDGRRVDVHYRDLDVVESEISEAEQGRFRIEPLLFHLAGIPTYLVVAELAVNRVLCGNLPRPSFPAALRRAAPEVWWNRAEPTFGYAAADHARFGRAALCLGLVAQAGAQAAHAVLAARGEWVTNEKQLLARAGLAELDDIVTATEWTPVRLEAAVTAARWLCEGRLQSAGWEPPAGAGQVS